MENFSKDHSVGERTSKNFQQAFQDVADELDAVIDASHKLTVCFDNFLRKADPLNLNGAIISSFLKLEDFLDSVDHIVWMTRKNLEKSKRQTPNPAKRRKLATSFSRNENDTPQLHQAIGSIVNEEMLPRKNSMGFEEEAATDEEMETETTDFTLSNQGISSNAFKDQNLVPRSPKSSSSFDSWSDQTSCGFSTGSSNSSYASSMASLVGAKNEMVPQDENLVDLSKTADEETLNINGIYVVERILAARKKNKKKSEYLLKWTDWPYETCTWEGREQLNCEELVTEFLNRDKIRRKIAKKLGVAKVPAFFQLQSFYGCQRWEDELNQIAGEDGQAPIYVENWVDSAVKPKDFAFITRNAISPEARQSFQPWQFKHKCSRKVTPYSVHGRLRKNFGPKEWIVECSEQCSCDVNSSTRLVQRGRQIPIVLFRTLDRGWSVRAAVRIQRRSFVMEYVGEVTTVKQAEKQKPQTYQFQMDGCGASECAFVVDAAKFGNEARFVNHSCDPNMVVHPVYADRFDKRYHRLTYFACRDIEKGEEITINYNAKLDNAVNAKRTRKTCLCKSENCRGFIS
ncbi:SET domain-containing protein [Ditylenchus destructor]|uniref:SET domain-containing protein n=1 Tax=Ditylenchus destructor TaxID=166010 RepID=A0AAD4MNI8_9BILA|nr:SET domain-containing protein [Ditylenchus destructor]